MSKNYSLGFMKTFSFQMLLLWRQTYDNGFVNFYAICGLLSDEGMVRSSIIEVLRAFPPIQFELVDDLTSKRLQIDSIHPVINDVF